MAEYIEREAAIIGLAASSLMPHQIDDAAEALLLVPAADVVPVLRGKWIWDDEGYHCSECFYHAYGETGEVLSGHWHYCPNCGARMDGDGDV